MSGPCPVSRLFTLLAVAGLVAPVVGARQARAQQVIAAPCRLCETTPDGEQARPAQPLRLEVQTRLEFDQVVFAGAGEALVALSPDGSARMIGADGAAGSRAMPGSVIVRGEPGRAVRIELPRQVALYGEGSSAIRIEALVTDLPSFPRIGADGTLSFRFGGDLRISGDGDGAYRGSIDITADYE